MTTITGTAGDDDGVSNPALVGASGDDNISGLDGNDLLEGGLGNDALDGGNGVDTVTYVHASGSVTVNLQNGGVQNTTSDGNDQLIGIENVVGSGFDDAIRGNGADNTLYGGAGADVLLGFVGNDTLYGGDNDDLIRGGFGDDAVYGGNGNDYVEGGEGNDVIDGGAGINRVAYSIQSGEPNVGATVDLNLQGVAQNTGHGMDTLTNIQHLSGTAFDDVLTGDGQDNWIWTQDGTDQAYGGAGNDLIELGFGTKTADGGTGTNTVSFNGLNNNGTTQAVHVDLTLQGAAQDTGAGMDTLTGFANVVGSNQNDTLTGDANANILAGNIGADTLYGGDGADVLYGDGLIAPDSGAYGYSGPIATFADVGVADAIPAEDGNDGLYGGAGDDTLYGGGGDDLIAGGAGNNVLYGGGGSDTVSYADATSGATIDLGAGEGSTATSSDTLYDIHGVVGSAFDDYVVGDSQGNAMSGGDGDDTLFGGAGYDVLSGGAGNDIIYTGDNGGHVQGDAGDDYLHGGAGADTLIGGDGLDRVVYYVYGNVDPKVGATVNLYLQDQAQNTGHGSDYLSGIEDVIGSQYDDLLTGDGNANWLSVLDGNDQAYGGGGDDLIQLGFGDKTVDGGSGINTLSYDSLYDHPVTVDLNLQGSAQDTGAGLVTLTNFANLMGSRGDDILTGDGAANVLAGSLGSDALYGGDGNDILYGDGAIGVDVNGFGNTDYRGDIVTQADLGIPGDYAVHDGADSLYGGDGDDTLVGGGASDALYGGAGNDTAVFSGNFSDYSFSVAAGVLTVVDNRAGSPNGTDTLSGVEQLQFANGVHSVASVTPASLAADELVLTRNVASDLFASVLLANDPGFDTVTGISNVMGGTASLVGGKLVMTSSGAGSFDYTATGSGGTGVGHATFYTFLMGDASEGYSGGTAQAADLNGAGGDDFLVGTAGADHLVGGLGADILDGQGGADVIVGSEGADFLIGRGGNDAIDGGADTDTAVYYGNLSDYTITRNDGIITVVDSRSGSPDGTDTLTHVEVLRFADGDHTVDSLFAPPSLAHPDVLRVTRGVPSALGVSVLLANDDGATAVTAISNVVGGTVAVVDGKLVIATTGSGSFDYTATGPGGEATGHVTFVGAIAGSGNDGLAGAPNEAAADLAGLDGNDTLLGTPGADHLVGGNGNDLLMGGTGADVMEGGAGNDSYVVQDAGDVVIEKAGEGADTVTALVNYVLTDNVEKLILDNGVVSGTGNSGDNTIVGNAAGNLLDGAGGADVMQGGAGDDTYYVDNVGDVIGESSNAGTDTVHTTLGAYTLTGNVENLIYDGAGDFSGTGNNLANTITGGGGNDALNGGTGADILIGGTGNDTYGVDNVGDVVVENAGEGVDGVLTTVSYMLGANTENMTAAGAGNINLTGNDLANTIAGNSGANVIDGGLGADAMAGGAGNDTYSVDNIGDTVTEGAGQGTDTVNASVDYTLSDNVEKLVLTGGAIHGTGSAQDNTIVGDALDNVLDGAAGADTLQGGLGDDSYYVDNAGDLVQEASGAGNDTVYADIGAYTLTSNVEALISIHAGDFAGTGNSSANAITGGAGNDTLDGKQGADVLTGGLGDDTYVVDNVGDVVVENPGEGHDTIQTSINLTLAAGLSVEALTALGVGNINLTGNELDNVLTGNAGTNVLNGGAGNDTMAGGAGNDTYVVESAGDTVIENVGEGVDTVQSSIDYALTANVEKLVLTGTAISGTGNGLDNTLTGNASDNLLDGGVGADTMIGGLGNDAYYVDNAGDLVTESGLGVDTVYASIAGYTLTSNVETLIFNGVGDFNGTGNTGANSLYGGVGNDTLNGLAGNDSLYGGVGTDALYGGDGNDMMDGGTGVDTLTGGLGNDTYQVDDAADLVVEAAGAGADLVIAASAAYALSDNVENLTAAGPGDFTGTGNILANVITGAGGNDSLYGLAGNDTLYGGAGADALYGGDGNDVLDGGTGNDTLTGGLGNDTYLVDSAGDVVVEAVGEGTDTVKATASSYVLSDNIEALTFVGAGDFAGTGNAIANTLTGGAGNDTLWGLAGNDKLIGGAGDDSLIGGAGADNLTGGAGADAFVFSAASESVSANIDTIVDFNAAEGDYIDLTAIDANSVLSGAQAFSFIGTSAFGHHAGELRYTVSGATLTLQGDINGDGLADFSLKLSNVSSLTGAEIHGHG